MCASDEVLAQRRPSHLLQGTVGGTQTWWQSWCTHEVSTNRNFYSRKHSASDDAVFGGSRAACRSRTQSTQLGPQRLAGTAAGPNLYAGIVDTRAGLICAIRYVPALRPLDAHAHCYFLRSMFADMGEPLRLYKLTYYRSHVTVPCGLVTCLCVLVPSVLLFVLPRGRAVGGGRIYGCRILGHGTHLCRVICKAIGP